MKNRSKFLQLLIVCGWTLTLFTSCIPSTSLLPSPTEQAKTNPYPSPIVTTSIPPKSMKTPITPTPTTTSTQKPPTWTPTSTPNNPTLTVDERRAKILKLLETNSNCELPCWWGIVPGQSSWPSVASFLQELGVKVGSVDEGSGKIFHGAGGFDFEAEQIHNNFGFTEVEGVVQSIHITSEGDSTPSFFQSIWKNYSPRNVLKQYGPPSRIFLRSSSLKWGNRNAHPYSLWIVYDALGFIIQYDGFAEGGNTFHFCPRFEQGQDIAYMRMYLQSPDSPVPLDPISDFAKTDEGLIRSIDETAGLSPNEFYKLFEPNSKDSCFETPSNIWP
jgi:hypothetical protein